LSHLVSKKILAIFIIVLLVVGIGAYFVGQITVVKPPPVKPVLSGEIPIGVLHSSASEEGYFQSAIDIAFEDVNKWFNESGIPIKLVPLVENAEESTTKACEKLESLIARGCQVVIGPQWSTTALAVKPIADERKVVLISPAAGSPALSIAGDYFTRTIPPIDAWQLVDVAIAMGRGVNVLVVVYSKDTFGETSMTALEKIAKEKGVVIYESFAYDPTAKDFTVECSKLVEKYKEAVSKFGWEKVGVEIIGAGGLAVPWLTAVGKFPELWKTASFVGPHVAGAKDVIQYTGDVAAKSGFTSIGPYARSPLSLSLKTRHKEKYGTECYTYGYAAYDAVWIAALSILATQEYKGEKLIKVIPSISRMYMGASGYCAMNEAGDRIAMDFEIKMVKFVNNTPSWVTIGYFDSSTQTLTWVST